MPQPSAYSAHGGDLPDPTPREALAAGCDPAALARLELADVAPALELLRDAALAVFDRYAALAGTPRLVASALRWVAGRRHVIRAAFGEVIDAARFDAQLTTPEP